jgi:hypothetical protein
MPFWKEPYRVRRSTRVLSYAVNQIHQMLNYGAESCYLLRRLARSNSPFQLADRRVSTITQVASSYSTDPDTGSIRFKIWGANTDDPTVFPDLGTLTATVQASGGATIWENAYDKYSFIPDRTEYAFDLYQDRLDSTGTDIEDSVYIVFNTPPFSFSSLAVLSYGTINPLTNFQGMQPYRDNQPSYQYSLFGFEQWLDPTVHIRRRVVPHAMLLAFPGVLTDFKITESGYLREQRASFFTSPPPYSPSVQEFDVIVRKSTSERYQVIDRTQIFLEDILVQQQFNMHALDPRSSIYSIPIVTS